MTGVQTCALPILQPPADSRTDMVGIRPEGIPHARFAQDAKTPREQEPAFPPLRENHPSQSPNQELISRRDAGAQRLEPASGLSTDGRGWNGGFTRGKALTLEVCGDLNPTRCLSV